MNFNRNLYVRRKNKLTYDIRLSNADQTYEVPSYEILKSFKCQFNTLSHLLLL